MADKVGEGYIEIDARIDEQDFVRSSQATARRAAAMFGDEYAKNLQTSLRGANRQFDVHINRQISSFQSLERQRIAAAEDSARRLRSIQDRIASDTASDRRISDAYEKEGKRAADAFAAEQNKSFSRITDAYRKGLVSLEDDSGNTSRRIGRRFEFDIDHHSRRGGGLLSRHILGAFDGVMSLLPSRLEFLFTRTGPIIGTAMFGGMAAALLIGVPALGAMFTGVFAASLGLGAVIGAVLVGVADDNRVLEAARRIRQNFVDNIIHHPDMQNLGAILAQQLDRVNQGLDRWAPHINSILQAGARFLPGITTGLLAMVDLVLPALDRFINSPFMTDIMNIVSHGIIVLGEAIAISFDRFLTDPQAVEGAKKGLEDLFNLMAGGIKLSFDLLRALSRFWEFLNSDPDGGGSGVSPLQRMRDVWEQVREIVGKIASPIIEAALSTLKRIFQELQGPLSLVGGALLGIANWFADEKNHDNIKAVTTLIIGLKVAMLGLNLAARAAAGGMSLFMAAGGFGFLGAGSNTDKLKNAGKGGAVGGLAALLLGGSGGQVAGATTGGAIAGPFGAIAGGGIATLMEQLLSDDKKKEIDREWQLLAEGNFRAYWEELKRDFMDAGVRLHQLLDPWGAAIKQRWNEAWGGLKSSFPQIWSEITAAATQNWSQFQVLWDGWLGGVKMRWNEAWGSFKGFFSERWLEITALASQWWSSFGIIFGAWLEGVKARWNESWGSTKQFFIDRWTELQAFAVTAWNIFGGILSTWLEGVKQRWNEAWGSVKQFFIDTWEDIKRLALDALGALSKLIDDSMRIISGMWSGWWTGMWGAMVGIWNNISTAVVGGINNVIDIINKGIGLINALLTKLGVSFQITPIGHVGGVTTPQPLPGMGNFSRMATGGRISGPGTGTSDSIPILASNGEYIINAKSTREWLPMLHAINRGMLPGFATGGYLGMFNWIKQRVPGVSMSSGFRPGDPGFHGKGMAIDMIFSDGSERRGGGLAALAFNMIKSAFMPIISELIWDFAGGNAVWNGRNHFFTGSGAGPGTHNDHIHWAQGGIGGGGGFLSGLFEWLGRGWNALVSELIEPMKKSVLDLFPQSNGMLSLGHGFAKVILDQAIAKIKVEFDEANQLLQSSMSSAGDFSGNGMAGALRWSGVATQALKMLGLPLSWLGPLLTLIGRESGGNPSAINRWDSNAAKGQPSQGLMQTIPSTFNAHKLPGYNNILAPLDNILAGLRYIVSRYGSIFNVQQANSRMSPAGYANGGVWHPGQLGVNETRKPEAILTESQWDALAKAGGATVVKVYVDGVEVAHRATVEKNNKDITQAFRRGRGVF